MKDIGLTINFFIIYIFFLRKVGTSKSSSDILFEEDVILESNIALLPNGLGFMFSFTIF